MGARDRWTSEFVRPKCGQRGVLHISEEDYRYSPANRSVDEVEGNFSVSAQGGAHYNIKCGKCGEEFKNT
jgi:hypothetical protein